MQKTQKGFKRLLSLLLAAAMCLSTLPTAVLAADDSTSATYTQVTSKDDVTSGGDFVLVAENEGKYYALDSTIGSKITAVEVTVSGDTVTADSLPVWTAASSDDGVSLSNGTNYLAYSSSTSFKSSTSTYEWDVAENNGTFRFTASGSSTRAIAYGISQATFGAYSTTNSTGYVFDLLVFMSDSGTTSGGGSGETPEAEDITKLTPTASYEGTLTVGSSITFQCNPLTGVSYEISSDGESWTALDGDQYTIPEGEAGNYTLCVRAKKDSAYSQTLTLSYTIEEETEEPEAPTGELQDGTYVIWAPAYNMALSGTYSGNYNAGVAVTEENGILSGYSSKEVWTISTNDDGTRTISQGEDKLSMDASYTSMPLNKANDTWEILPNSNGTYYVHNIGRDAYIEWYDSKSYWSCYYSIADGSESMFELAFTPVTLEETEEPDTTVTGILTDTLSQGDQVVLYYPNSRLALSDTASGSKLTGVDATVDGDTLTSTGAVVLTVRVTSDGSYTFATEDGKYLTSGATGSSLSFGDKTDYSLWTLEEADGGFYIKNVNAKYGSNNQYLEYYSGFTTYSFSSSNPGIYTYQFYKTGHVDIAAEYDTDSSLVETIAQWGGGGPYDDAQATSVLGDKYTVGDMKDSAASFTVVANGVAAQPYQQTSTNTGGYNYYMGGTNIGAAEGDYMQFALSTAGWGDMTMSFRLRATNAAPGSFQLQYSADGGETFANFTTGEYSYAYTKYTSTGTSDVVDSGSIADGVARTSLAPTYYVSFSFDVPSGADNADSLLIRLVAGTEKANGATGTPGGNIRIDSVKLTGSPIVDDSITGYVTVTPDGVEEDQAPGTELTMTTATEGASIQYRFVNTEDGSGQWNTYDADAKPVLPETLPAVLEVKATCEGKADSITRIFQYAAGSVQSVKMTPNGGGVYISGTSINVELSCATEGATIYYSLGVDDTGADLYQVYDAESPIVLNKGFGSQVIKAYAIKEGFRDSAVTTRTFTERDSETYNIYFGQMHSHTSYSDGAGTADDAYSHATNVENLDFLAVTDHSNSFDGAADSEIASDASAISEEWKEGKALAEQYTTDTFVGLFGFEMTWSNGLGHINTFNTPGFQSRTQSAYSTYATALQNYYASLKTVSDSISQFNHPGTTFGDFSDFAYFDEEIDQLITLIEVGNGEGAIGSSSYFPSYEYYTRALDKGWHVAPTNNQDNHKGLWGDANTARSVVLADSLTESDIYDAMRNYRVYATEDNDLSIYYTLDGNIMGTILSEGDVDDTVTLNAKISDPTDSAIGKVEVIVNGGLSVSSQTFTAAEADVTFTVPSSYSYYYLKITEADGDIAVTAPVWVGEVEAVGISTFTTDATLAVQNQELNLTLDLYNNEKSPLNIESIVFSIEGDEATGVESKDIHTADLTDLAQVKAMGTGSYTFSYTYDGLGATTFVATVTGTLNGVEKVYKEKLTLNYVAQNMVTRVVIDGTHYNDYVTGYYGGNMGNFTSIAAGKSVDVSVVTDEITAETLEDCALLVISAPARKSGTANAGAYTASTFEDSFIELVADYVKDGGSVVVCGLADYQDKSAVYGADGHASAQMNKLLTAIGSSMRINDDEVYDPVSNGGQFYRLYPSVFNTDSSWTVGVVDGQVYSQYSGCSVDPGDGTWLVKGFDTTYSVDSDKDGVGNTDEIETDDSYGYNIVTPRGEVVFLACEDTAYGGTVFAAGGVFMSDFEVDADVDDYALPYANRTIAENILEDVRVELPITPIADVRAVANTGSTGDVFRVQGYVTAGRENENNEFFDGIYIQDETGGIDIFPYAEEGLKVGATVEVTGYLDSYQGDLELRTMAVKVLDNENLNIIEPAKVSCADAMDYTNNGGSLLQVEGTVKENSLYYNADGTLAQFVVVDEAGGEATVFIDGYIRSGTTGENTLADSVVAGATVSAVGILYMHPEVFIPGETGNVPVLRVRNCDEIVVLSAPVEHIHSYGAPVFNWAEDYTCTAVFTCEAGDDEQTISCTVTSEVTREATTTKEGLRTYTATVEFADVTYTDTTTEVIPAKSSSIVDAFRNLVEKIVTTVVSIIKKLFGR